MLKIYIESDLNFKLKSIFNILFEKNQYCFIQQAFVNKI